MKTLILVNGELNAPDILQDRIKACSFDMVIGADRGALHAQTLGLTLNAVIGDMDSLKEQERHEIERVPVVCHPAEKDETDLELALLYAKTQGADRIVMVGVTGGRLDMTISNIMLMTHPELVDCRVEIWDGAQTGWIIRPPGGDIAGYAGDTVSFVPLSDSVTGITNAGFKYPLHDAILTRGSPRGVSNILEKTRGYIKFNEGLLLAVHIPSRA